MNKNSEYEKMPKSLNGFALSEKNIQDLGKLKWVVTEKIHGANFSFVYEDKKLLFAKRKEYLKWTDDFFGFQIVVNKIEEQVLQLFEQLRIDIKADRYIIYGELFGGKYPHAEVTSVPYVQAIQTGVYYCPSINFCAFDIAIESDSGNQRYFLDYKTAISYFEKFNLFYARILFSGKLNEALEFNLRINSSIPTQLNLPEINSNLIEGVIIKPLTHTEVKNLAFRPILKIKNPEFDEEQKFHEAEKWSFLPNVTSQSEDLNFILEEMNNYVNKNRLESVLSKTGALDFQNEKRMMEIQQEFLRDVLFDFNDNNNHLLESLAETQISWLKNRLNVSILECINTFR